MPTTAVPGTYVSAFVRDGEGSPALRAPDFSPGYKNVGLAACIEGDANFVAQVCIVEALGV
ncbi:MAG: hypothetical protein MUQ30_15210 [Anaerolineae bacterium]|nr:hypothetical protein [Anaerolineae bacterium]